MIGYVGDNVEDIHPNLFADANLAEKESSYSTSGIHLAMLGKHTNFPLTGISKGQSCVSHSTPEAEIVAANLALRMLGLPGLEMWDILLAREVVLLFREDNTAMIRIMETGRNPTMKTLERNFGISVAWLNERLKSGEYVIVHCGSKNMSAGIYTK